jgi:histidinol-phosphate aminotransferase
MSETYFTLERVAQILQVSYLTVYRWVRAGKLPASKVGRQYRVSQSNFAAFMDKDKPRSIGSASQVLHRFIGSGMMDYSYIESRHFAVDLTLGINPLGTPFDVRKYLGKVKLDYSQYSSVTAVELRKNLAQFHQVKPSQILVGAGASELLHLVFLTFLNPGETVFIPEVSFPAFEMLALLVHANLVLVPLTQSFDIDVASIGDQITTETKVVVLCSPNNPTGRGLDYRRTLELITHYPQTKFLIDEANIDFGGTSFVNDLAQLSNLIIARSFSKGFGLAGLRVGYLISHPDAIYALQRRQTPFMTNVVGQVVAARALDFPQFLEKSRQYCQTQRQWLEVELHKLGFSFIPSDSNYLLVDVSSVGLRSNDLIAKLNHYGANAIDGRDFRGLGDRYIRLSPRDTKTNQKFIAILKKVVENLI